MKITFKHIKIENFKNIQSLEFDFGNKTFIYGANETGKTTVADAIAYVLTGKNSLGESQFIYLPIGKTGLSPTVVLTVEMDSGKSAQQYVLSRTYQAKQNRAKEFTGEYQTMCFINGLKIGPKDFDKWIEEYICKPEIFRLIHDVRYFTENIATTGKERPWEAQRRLLFTLANVKSDSDFARSKKRYEPIAMTLGGYDSANQYLEYLQSRERNIENMREETDQEIARLTDMILDAGTNKTEEEIKAEIAEFIAQKESIERVAMEKATAEYVAKEKERNTKLSELTESLEKLNKAFSDSQEAYISAVTELNKERSEKSAESMKAQTQLVIDKNSLSSLEKRLEMSSKTCPTCGQTIPDELFEKEQKELRDCVKKYKKSIAFLNQKIADTKKALADIEEKYKSIETPKQSNELSMIKLQISELRKENRPMWSVTLNPDDTEKVHAIEYNIQNLNEEKAKAVRVTQLKAKKKEQEEELKKILDERADNRRLIDLCVEFISEKAKYAINKINKMFDGIQFEVFSQNKTNDEIRNCCNIFWNGVPYESLSYSTKFIVSMNIALAFQRGYSVSMPIVCDNAESIDFSDAIPVQSILLVKRDELCPNCGSETGRKEDYGMWKCKKCGNMFRKSLEIKTKD